VISSSELKQNSISSLRPTGFAQRDEFSVSIAPPGQEGWPKAGVVVNRREASSKILAKPTLLNSERFEEIHKDAARRLTTTPLAALAAPPGQEGRWRPESAPVVQSQYQRNPRRRQSMTVSGLTIARAERRILVLPHLKFLRSTPTRFTLSSSAKIVVIFQVSEVHA
jgi:hypothetical protein